jgi:hypothetical protein
MVHFDDCSVHATLKTPLHDASTIKRSGHGYFAIETLPRPAAPMAASILGQHAFTAVAALTGIARHAPLNEPPDPISASIAQRIIQRMSGGL